MLVMACSLRNQGDTSLNLTRCMNFLLGLARRIEIVSYRASREKESRKQIKLIRENKLYVVFLGLLSV